MAMDGMEVMDILAAILVVGIQAGVMATGQVVLTGVAAVVATILVVINSPTGMSFQVTQMTF